MKRYIDADKLEDDLYQQQKTLDYCHKKQAKGIEIARAILDRQPTADVQEVKHGKWVYHYRLKKFVCLECGYEQKHKPEWNYCPNCGAKTDGKE